MSTRKSAVVVVAPGSEEMEATIAIDVLRRAEVDVVVAGLDGAEPVTCSRGVVLQPDCALADVSQPKDVTVLPGGRGGAEAFAASGAIGERLRTCEREDRLTAVICAAPLALASHGAFSGKRMTSHPSVKTEVEAHGRWVDEPVVRDGMLLTSQGPGTAFAFSLAIVEILLGPEKAEAVRGPMMLRR